MESQKAPVLHTKMFQVVTTHLVLSPARMLLTGSNVPENARSIKEIRNAALNAPKIAKIHSVEENLMINVKSMIT